MNAGPITPSTAISKKHLRVGLAKPEKASEAASGTEGDRDVRSSNLALPEMHYSQDFQSFPAGLVQRQVGELAVFRVFLNYFGGTTI